MPIGTTEMTCYQGEDVSWQFTISDPRITNSTGYAIRLVVKLTAAAPNPPLIGPITCVSTDTLEFKAEFNVDLDPGTYVYSVRRIDAGFSWQLAQGTLTVLDSASIDI